MRTDTAIDDASTTTPNAVAVHVKVGNKQSQVASLLSKQFALLQASSRKFDVIVARPP
jgi:hypothetical protein